MEEKINYNHVYGTYNPNIIEKFHKPTEEQKEKITAYYTYNYKRDSKAMKIFMIILLMFTIILFFTMINSIVNKNMQLAKGYIILEILFSLSTFAIFKSNSEERKKYNQIISGDYVVHEAVVSEIKVPKHYTAPGTCDIKVASDSISEPDIWLLVRMKDVEKGSPVLILYIEYPKRNGKVTKEFRAFTNHMFTKQGMREHLSDSPMNPAA